MNKTMLPSDNGLIAQQLQSQQATRYCDNCHTHVEPVVMPVGGQDYHGQDTAPIECPDCGQQFGHAVFWPQ